MLYEVITIVKLTKVLYLKPELLYEYSKGRLLEDYIKTHSLTTPLQLVFKTPYKDVYTPRLNIGIGGFHSYHFA